MAYNYMNWYNNKAVFAGSKAQAETDWAYEPDVLIVAWDIKVYKIWVQYLCEFFRTVI